MRFVLGRESFKIIRQKDHRFFRGVSCSFILGVLR